MDVLYVYCSACGLEDFDVYIAFSRTTADGDWWVCPECGEECSNVDTGCEDDES